MIFGVSAWKANEAPVGRRVLSQTFVPSGASLLVHPAIAESCASAIDGVVSDPDVRGRLATAAVEGPELLRRFAGISDGRSDQGRDHPVGPACGYVP